jgi:hypothetical protein
MLTLIDVPWLYYIVFSDDYSSCEVYNAEIELEVEKFTLLD